MKTAGGEGAEIWRLIDLNFDPKFGIDGVPVKRRAGHRKKKG